MGNQRLHEVIPSDGLRRSSTGPSWGRPWSSRAPAADARPGRPPSTDRTAWPQACSSRSRRVHQGAARARLPGVAGSNHLTTSTILVPRSSQRAVPGLREVFGHPSATVRALPEDFTQHGHAVQHLPIPEPTSRTGQAL